MKKTLFHIIFLAVCFMANGQDKSNKGKEFWLGYGYNVLFENDFPVNNQNLVLYISAEAATQVTVTVSGTLWARVINIPANSVDFSVILPKAGADDCRIFNEGIFDRGIHIVSTEPVVVYAHQYNAQLSGATMLMPVETYGHTYYSINYHQPYYGGAPGKNWFFVVASEDNTTLQITPSDTTEGGRLPGQTFTVNLNKGQLYNVFGKVALDGVTKDLTGSKIVSVVGTDGNCHPVALFSGCSRFLVCTTDGGEVAQQQIFPANAWGTRYLAYHSFNVTTNPLTTPFLNFFRVIVTNPATVVKRNGVVLTGLQNNSFYEFQSTSGDFIEADMPVMVCQYTPNSNQCTGSNPNPQGDPEMFFLSPIEQGIKKATVYNTRNNNITICYLTIIIPNNGIASLRIDGAVVPASQYITHPYNSGYKVVAKRLLGSAAQHTIASDSAFTALIYGTGTYESYGYIAGTLVNNLNSIGSIKNIYNNTSSPNNFTCPRSPMQFTVRLAYRATSLQWLFSQVNNILPARDTLLTAPVPIDSAFVNGRKYYTYQLNAAYQFSDTGMYAVPIIYTSPDIDNCNQQEKSTVAVQVKPGPVADFSSVYTGCSKDTVFLINNSIAGGYNLSTYIWGFDDGTIDSVQHTKRVFLPGNHPVRFKIIADNGCVDDTTKIITTNVQPVAKFGYDRNICINDSIRFTDSSSVTSGAISQWYWGFADGNNIIRNNGNPFFHLYGVAGNYRVGLTVTSDKGCVSDSFFVPVVVKNKPQVSFSISGKACVDSSLTFTPTVIANGNTIQSGQWFFGDGQTMIVSDALAVTHPYSAVANNIPVKLVLSGGAGCEADTARGIVAIIHAKPVAKFGINAGSFCPQAAIGFADSSTGNIQSWKWDFGNGFAVATPPINHSYPTAGNYTIGLTVTSTDGCGSDLYTRPLTIFAPPNVDAGPAVVKLSAQPVVLTASVNSSGTIQYSWTPTTFLNSPNILTPATTSPNDIVYTLTVKGGQGNCEASDTVSVKILKEIYIPNAFSPDNSGKNDFWNIPAINGNPKSMVTIFNRWGQIIFESRGYPSPWDGTYKGVTQPVGAYFYVIQPDVSKPRKITGSVMIIR